MKYDIEELLIKKDPKNKEKLDLLKNMFEEPVSIVFLNDDKQFPVHDGEYIKVAYQNGYKQEFGPFDVVDSHHFNLNGECFHKLQFADRYLKDGRIVDIYRKDGK